MTPLVKPYISAFAWFLTTDPYGCGVLVGNGVDPLGGQQFYQKPIFDLTCNLTSENIVSLIENFVMYNKLHGTKHEGIKRAVDLYRTNMLFPSRNRLHVLGYFAILEMLLTHKPNDKEIGDSLMHQLKTKIDFISSRLTTKIDYSGISNTLPTARIWNELYAYRSAIAHGDHIDLSKKHGNLKDEHLITSFIAEVTRTIIKYALKEPDLVNGLKPI